MLRNSLPVLKFALALACVTTPFLGGAQTFYVGTCKPGKADYNTIQEAVSNVPPGSTINVCPGIYAEQVKITQPLTLNGVQTDNDANVVITAPAGQLATFMANPLTFVAAQLEVIQSGGAVNISGVTVDGTSLAIPGVTFGTNILYESSPGAVNHVVLKCPPIATSAIDGTTHSGIIVMDDYSVSPAVTIENSSVISTLASGNAIGV